MSKFQVARRTNVAQTPHLQHRHHEAQHPTTIHRNLIAAAANRISTANNSASSYSSDDDDYMTNEMQRTIAKWTRDAVRNSKSVSPATPAVRHHQPRSGRKLRRIDLLAQPKLRNNLQVVAEPFRVRASALAYRASDRLSDLANPKRLHVRPLVEAPVQQLKKVSPYVLSERLALLAQPKQPAYRSKRPRQQQSEKSSLHSAAPSAKIVPAQAAVDDEEARVRRLARLVELTRLPRHKLEQAPVKKPGAVAYSALVCRPSPRIEELAGPRVRRTPKTNEYAFSIKPAALKYQPTNRINNLAVARTKKSRARAEDAKPVAMAARIDAA